MDNQKPFVIPHINSHSFLFIDTNCFGCVPSIFHNQKPSKDVLLLATTVGIEIEPYFDHNDTDAFIWFFQYFHIMCFKIWLQKTKSCTFLPRPARGFEGAFLEIEEREMACGPGLLRSMKVQLRSNVKMCTRNEETVIWRFHKVLIVFSNPKILLHKGSIKLPWDQLYLHDSSLQHTYVGDLCFNSKGNECFIINLFCTTSLV